MRSLRSATNTRRTAALGLAILAWSGCTRVVELVVEEGPKRLVVQARLQRPKDGADGRQVFYLSTTDAVQSSRQLPPAVGARVRVTDEQGRPFDFEELPDLPGQYFGTVLPVIGRGYTLTIDYQGERYQAFHRMLPVAPIDSLYFVFLEEGVTVGEAGLRAAIDYTDPPGEENYYLWELRVNGLRQGQVDPGSRFRMISEDRFYDGGTVIGYQPYDDEIVLPGNVVEVRQIALSKDAYRYYYVLLEQMTGGGGPFSTPPASVRGNVANLTNPSNPALGYFYAAELAIRTRVVPRE